MMRTELFWPLAFCGFAAVSLVCGIVAWPMLSAAWPSIRDKIDRFRRLPPLAKLLLLLFVGAFVVYGSTKTNLVDQTSGTNAVEIVEGGTNDVDQVKGEGEGEQRNLLTCSAGQLELEGNILCSPSPITFTLAQQTWQPLSRRTRIFPSRQEQRRRGQADSSADTFSLRGQKVSRTASDCLSTGNWWKYPAWPTVHPG